MEYLQAVSTWLGSFVINLLPKSFGKIIEPESDLSSFLGAFIAIAIVFGVLFFVVLVDNQLKIDKCLDSLGKWNNEQKICEFSNK